jgi:polar amino acid transport system substrate-binding protein
MKFYTKHLPPHSIVIDGKISGTLPEITLAVCAEMKVKCSININPWNRIVNNVKSGQYSGMFPVGKTIARNEWLYFTSPVVENEYGFFSYKGTKAPNVLADLKGRTIVVHINSSTHAKLQKLQKTLPGFKIHTELNVRTVLKKFNGGRYDKSTLIYGNHEIYEYLFKDLGLTNIKYSFGQSKILYHLGLSKKGVTEAMADRFQEILSKMLKSGKLNYIYERNNAVPVMN